MLSLILILFGLLYVAAGFAIRIGWSKLNPDEQLAWKVAFPIHGLFFGDVKMRVPPTGVLISLTALAAFVLACYQPSKEEFAARWLTNFFGIVVVVTVFSCLFCAINEILDKWFR